MSIKTEYLLGIPYNIILVNNDVLNFDIVVEKVIKSIKCSLEKAMSHVLETHIHGKSILFTGHLEQCELIYEILLKNLPNIIKIEKDKTWTQQ